MLPPKELEALYGAEMAEWLYDQLDHFLISVDDPCTDNYRMADSAVPEQVHKYEDQRINGCCGASDHEVTHEPSGKKFLIGFNYGH